MRIFIAGSRDPWASEASYARMFSEMGCEVFVWDDKAPYPPFWKRSWWDMNRAERLVYDSVASIRFYRACCDFKPDILFMPKAENIHSYAVKRALETTRARLIIWYPDNPFKADQTSMNILRNLRRCDTFYIWGKFLIDALRTAGCRRVEYLPFGYDPVLHPTDSLLTQEQGERFACDICFIGTWDEEREASLQHLADFDLAIWGPYWPEKIRSSSPLAPHIRGSGLYGPEMVQAFKASKLVFNHLREHNGSAHNIRTMEITGVGGGPMVVRRTVEQASELFTDGKEVVCFGSIDELRERVVTLLADPSLRLSISANARERVKKAHLLKYRIEEILTNLGA